MCVTMLGSDQYEVAIHWSYSAFGTIILYVSFVLLNVLLETPGTAVAYEKSTISRLVQPLNVPDNPLLSVSESFDKYTVLSDVHP